MPAASDKKTNEKTEKKLKKKRNSLLNSKKICYFAPSIIAFGQ